MTTCWALDYLETETLNTVNTSKYPESCVLLEVGGADIQWDFQENWSDRFLDREAAISSW